MAKDKEINRDFVVVGLGNMGASLTKGLLKSGMPKGCRLKVFDVHRDRLHAFADQDVSIVGNLDELANQEICLILCIKPHDLKGLADTLGGKLHPNSMVISILAGTSIEQIEAALSFKGPVVRSMPNIAATIGMRRRPCAATRLARVNIEPWPILFLMVSVRLIGPRSHSWIR